jgi:hypothetical protein
MQVGPMAQLEKSARGVSGHMAGHESGGVRRIVDAVAPRVVEGGRKGARSRSLRLVNPTLQATTILCMRVRLIIPSSVPGRTKHCAALLVLRSPAESASLVPSSLSSHYFGLILSEPSLVATVSPSGVGHYRTSTDYKYSCV